jgi:large subunit ribosomal protein L16
MLTPSRVRYRKTHRGRMKGKARRNSTVLYGDLGLMAMEPRWITANQIESARIAITRATKKHGKMWIRIFPDKPFTKKPAETRQGKGKGNPEGYVAVVRPGQIRFEVKAPEAMADARQALVNAGNKMPIKWRIVERTDF